MSTTIPWVVAPDGRPRSGETLNVVRGCTPVSQGCLNCYAARLASGRLRRHRSYDGLTACRGWVGRVRVEEELIKKPLRWKKPRGVFWCDMGDLFHPDVPRGFINNCLEVVFNTRRHRHFWLTKRAERMAEWADGCLAIPNNLWLGVTAETQKDYDERVPHLRKCPAAVRFVSMEPLLTGIVPDLTDIDWVIVGCEQLAGRKVGRLHLHAQDMRYTSAHTAWECALHNIIGACQGVGVACFVKQIPGENGKVSHDPATWPAWMNVREWPEHEA